MLLAAVSLAACSVLPTSGPSSREIKAGAAVGIRVIDVDDTVTRQLQERRSQLLFSDVFPGAPASDQIVQPGDVL
ncbi:MAG: polysaccharide export protein, partial [Deltaproteobacteria bacterium]